MRKAAVLHLLGVAARVGDARGWRDDDVRGAGILGRVVVVEGQAWTIVDLTAAPGGAVGFEQRYGLVGVGGVRQPQQRDVVFSGAHAASVRILRRRHGNVKLVGDQGRGREAIA